MNHAEPLQRVRTIVKNLKSNLGHNAENPTCIFNEPRTGYRLDEQEESRPSH